MLTVLRHLIWLEICWINTKAIQLFQQAWHGAEQRRLEHGSVAWPWSSAPAPFDVIDGDPSLWVPALVLQTRHTSPPTFQGDWMTTVAFYAHCIIYRLSRCAYPKRLTWQWRDAFSSVRVLPGSQTQTLKRLGGVSPLPYSYTHTRTQTPGPWILTSRRYRHTHTHKGTIYVVQYS